MNAHYTSPTVISAIYDVLNNLGFEKGNILEPAMGTGNFFGMLPELYKDSKLYGVELDSITGRIAQQLLMWRYVTYLSEIIKSRTNDTMTTISTFTIISLPKLLTRYTQGAL